MSTPTEEKVSLKTKIGFGSGDIYGGGATLIIGFMYLYFLTDVIHLDPAMAGLVVLISKVWDAVSDPLMGMISDRTRSRWGRRRPYLLFGIPLIFLSFLVMWYPVRFESESARFAFVVAGYLFFSTVNTLIMIPYNALSSELTLDYNERTSLQSFRMFFSAASSILCALVPLEIVKRFEDPHRGYVMMAVFFGVLFALPFLAVFFTTRERPAFIEKSPTKINFKTTFVAPFTVRSFLNVLFMYLFAFVAMDMVNSIVLYYMTYYIGRGGLSNYVLGVLLVFNVASLPLFGWISRKTSKRIGYIIAAAIWIITLFFSFLFKPGMPVIPIYIFAAVLGVGIGGVIFMVYATFPDMPDIDELHSGMRREGIYSGLFTFMRKLSSAIGIFLIGQALSLAGYKAPVEETVNGVTTMVQQQQTGEFILVLRVIFVAAPLIFLTFAVFNAVRYPLTPAIHGDLRDLLMKKRAGGALSAEEQVRFDEYHRVLVERKGGRRGH